MNWARIVNRQSLAVGFGPFEWPADVPEQERAILELASWILKGYGSYSAAEFARGNFNESFGHFLRAFENGSGGDSSSCEASLNWVAQSIKDGKGDHVNAALQILSQGVLRRVVADRKAALSSEIGHACSSERESLRGLVEQLENPKDLARVVATLEALWTRVGKLLDSPTVLDGAPPYTFLHKAYNILCVLEASLDDSGKGSRDLTPFSVANSALIAGQPGAPASASAQELLVSSALRWRYVSSLKKLQLLVNEALRGLQKQQPDLNQDRYKVGY